MRSERLSHTAIRWPYWLGFPTMNTFAPAWLEFGAQTRWRSCLNPKKRWRCPIVVCRVPTPPPAVSWAAPGGFPAPPSISTISWFRSERAEEAAIFVSLQMSQKRAQGPAAVANEAYFDRITQTDSGRIQVYLNTSCRPGLGQEFNIRKRSSHHQKSVAFFEGLLRRFGA